jgi:AcrR family transcriptional regulator
VVSRRDVEFARTREDILMAAARALGRRGFGSVSMHEIAADVGFTAPALYAYFPSKEDIFSELEAMLQREIADTFHPPPAGGQSFRRRLSILLGRQLEWADRRRDVLLAFTAMRARGEAMPFRAQAGRAGPDAGPRAHLLAMARWLRQAAPRPEDLGGCAPDEAACLLFGICHGFLLRWLLGGSQTRLADETERILDFFFHGVRGATATQPSTSRRAAAPRPRSGAS